MVSVRTSGLTKYYGRNAALRNLNLEVGRGEIFGYLGPNGAGKTTTVKILTGALHPTSGQAWIDGLSLGEHSQYARRIGVVFGENLSPEPTFSTVRYLRYFARTYGLEHGRAERRIRQLIGLLRLSEAEKPIGTLSGGNRRKVELARALLHEPSVLFLDEPTRELDVPSKRDYWQFLATNAKESRLTVFLSSHDPEEIAYLCARIAILRDGQVSWTGTPAQLRGSKSSLTDALAEKLEERARFEEVQRSGPSPARAD